MSNKDPQGVKFKWNATSPFSFAAVKAVHPNQSAISCQTPLLLLFEGLLYKGTSIKIWQWDGIYWSSSWTLRTQEACCIGSTTSVKNSEICKFRSIYMAFYSPTLRETFGGWHILYEILLKRLLGVTALTFKELCTLRTQAKVCLNFWSPNSFVQWSKWPHLS